VADPEVTAVIVATTTITHEKIIRSALAAGKHVFTEKPVAETEAESARCFADANDAGRILFTAFNRRYDPSFADVRRRVRQGDVGHAHVVRTTSRDSPVPSLEFLKTSGGFFHDCVIHDLDLVTWTVGEFPSEVVTFGNAQIPEIAALDDVDNVIVTMKFPSGTLGNVNASRMAVYGYDQRLEVFGPSGMVMADNDTPNTVVAHTKNGSQRYISPSVKIRFSLR